MFGSLIKAINSLVAKLTEVVTTLQANVVATNELTYRTRELKASVVELDALIGGVLIPLLRLRKPGPTFLVVTDERNNMLLFKLMLPALAAVGTKDVVKRTITMVVGDSEPAVFELEGEDVSKSELEDPAFKCEDNTKVTVIMFDTDDAGNVSESTTSEFVVTDTLPPPAPGQVGLAVTSEE